MYKYRTWIFLIGGLALLLLFLLQDLAQSVVQDSAFYASESFLFNSFYLLFIPGVYLLYRYLKTSGNQITLSRAGLFLPGIVIAHQLVFALIVFLISFLFFDFTFPFGRTFVHALATKSIICVLMYGATFVWAQYNFQRNKAAGARPEKIGTIAVRQGTQTIPVKTDEIIYIRAETPYVALITDDRKYLHNSSLKAIGQSLDDATFIRIHRSTIVNRSRVVAFQSRQNGDYDVELSNGDIVRLSRNYADRFKELLA